jgi:GNAT superfamily N-acetyltransferase
MKQNYTIELAKESHIREIPGIEQAAAAMFSESDLPIELRYRVTDIKTLVGAQREGRLWAALDGDRTLVGFAMVGNVGGLAHLEEMDVHPEHTRQGIGSRLLHAVTTWARGNGYPGMTLITFRHLPWNAPFYERYGFIQLDEQHNSDDLRELLREEAEAGIEPRKRVAMLYEISGGSGSAAADQRA